MGQLFSWLRDKSASKKPGSNKPSGEYLTFSVQYNGEFLLRDRSYHILDLWNYGTNDIKRVVKAGSIPVAYFSTQYEAWRPDAKDLIDYREHSGLDGWRDEDILDPGRMDEWIEVLYRRIDFAQEKGFQAIDADNIDGFYFYHSSKDMNACAELWNKLASYARSKDMLVGLKNSGFLFGKVNNPDFLVTESIYKWNEANTYQRFGKPIFNTEYSKKEYKKALSENKFHTIYKDKMKMDSWEG